MIQEFIDKTPESFIISAKFPGEIVHAGKSYTPDIAKLLIPEYTYETRDTFLERMAKIGPRLGPLLLQFPYFSKRLYSNAGPFVERLEQFLSDLPQMPFRYAVEIRNRTWLTTRFMDMLRRYNVALALTDHPWMPHGDEMRFDPVTTDFVYIRLLGDRKAIEEITTSWDKVVVDNSDRIERWASLIRKLVERDLVVYTYSNNHYSGHAPATTRQLMELVER